MTNLSLNGDIYLVSDIHLGPDIPKTNSKFYQFLDLVKSKNATLIILGDLFDVWYGDDMLTDNNCEPWLTEAIKHLQNCAKTIPTYYIHGNRDFLLGSKAALHIGFKVLNERAVIHTSAGNLHISHGDEMCTDEKGYMIMRAVFRNTIVQKLFLSLSIRKRKNIAAKIRNSSQIHKDSTSKKSIEYSDVNQGKLKRILHQNHDIQHFIHGHTHKPYIHKVTDNVRRYVLPDWDFDHDNHTRGGYIKISANGDIVIVDIV